MRTPETISRLLEAAGARGWRVRRRSIGGWPWPAVEEKPWESEGE